MSGSFHRFIEEARMLLRPGDCETRAGELEKASSATFPTTSRVLAVLRVRAASLVSPLLRLCAAHGVAWHVYSAGTNWGLGSTSPVQDAVLIDLRALDRILDFDDVLGTLTLEPGVTFGQAWEYLCERRAHFWLAPVGGTDRASVVANALQRGDGYGPLADRAAHTAALDVVLANGEEFRTGFTDPAAARMRRLAKDASGPSLEGLFFQSNLAVITAMTLWLAPVPESWQRGAASFRGEGALGRVLDLLGGVMRDGLCSPGCWTVWNVYKLLALKGRYPWASTGGKTPLDVRFIGAAGDPRQAPWYLSLTLTAADAALLGALRERIDARFEGAAVWDEPKKALDVGAFEPARPSSVNLRTVYWRKRSGPPEEGDPDRDRCGLIWICIKAPADCTSAPALVAVQKLALVHGFELHTAFSAVSIRALNVYCALVYDRDVPGEDDRAAECHVAIVEEFRRHGMPVYRAATAAGAGNGRAECAAVRAIRKAWADPFVRLDEGIGQPRSHRP